MTGRLGTVKASNRVMVDNVPTVQVEVLLGGGGDSGEEVVTAELMLPPGADALPLAGDEVVIDDAEGSGDTTATGFADPKNPGVAKDGEHRTYARDAAGVIVCEIWLKEDGTPAVKSLKPGSKIDLNGVFIDQQGNMFVPGEVTAMVGTPQSPLPGVKLSKHLHGTGVGPTTAPTPGT